MIRASDEFKKKLLKTLQRTEYLIHNDVINVSISDRQNYYADVLGLLHRLACMIQFEDDSNHIMLRTNDEINKEIDEKYKD
jgi:hypothetical protein